MAGDFSRWTVLFLLFVCNSVADCCRHDAEYRVCQPDQCVAAGSCNADSAEPCAEETSDLMTEENDAEQGAEFLRTEKVASDAGGRWNSRAAGESQADGKCVNGDDVLRKQQERYDPYNTGRIQRAENVFHREPAA